MGAVEDPISNHEGSTSRFAWRVPDARTLSPSSYAPVTVSGASHWRQKLDACLCFAASLLGAILVPFELLSTRPGPAVVGSILCWSSAAVCARIAFTGLEVSRYGVRVRRTFRTRTLAWSQITVIEMATGPGLVGREWDVLWVRSVDSSTPVLDIKRQKPDASPGTRQTQELGQSTDGVVSALLQLRNELSDAPSV